MYNNNKILALIPARGGSKGIKNKNIINVNGQPLISYTIQASIKSKYIDSTIVSTDSTKIASVARSYGAIIPFMRPEKYASDTSKTIDVVLHAIDTLMSMNCTYDVLVLLQPTQPLRTTEDIDKAVELFFQNGQNGVVSISKVDDHPILIRTIDKNNVLTSLLGLNSTCRRQDMPNYYRVNGGIYINRIKDINASTSFNDNPIGFIMAPSHSVDIDEYKDILLAEYYLNHQDSTT